MQLAVAQFARQFGDGASDPLEIYNQYWAVDCFIATPDDSMQPLPLQFNHPTRCGKTAWFWPGRKLLACPVMATGTWKAL